MPYKLLVDGEVRWFDFYAPRGWQQYVWQNNRGLPVLIVLHNAARNPSVMQVAFPFQNTALEPSGLLDDRFFVFFPYASGARGAQIAAEPDAVWAYGYDSRGFSDAVDDVRFVDEMVAHVEQQLTDALLDAGVTGIAPFDEERFYLYGIEEGGQMVHRLVSQSPDRYAAIYTVSASHAGLAHSLVQYPGIVVNAPDPAARPIHVFTLEGTLVKYITDGPTPPTTSSIDAVRLNTEIQNSPVADTWARADVSQDATVQMYAAHAGNWWVWPPLGGFPSVATAWTSTVYVHLQPLAGWPPPLGVVFPTIMRYVDPVLTDALVSTGDIWYARAPTVWTNWFHGKVRPT